MAWHSSWRAVTRRMLDGLMARRNAKCRPALGPDCSAFVDRVRLRRRLLEEGAHTTVEPELALEIAVGRVLERDGSLLEDADERLDQRSVELGAGHATKLGNRLLRRNGLPVRVAGRHHVVRVGDRDHAREQWDVRTIQPVRIPGAVDPLVMAADDLGHGAVAR